MMGPNRVDYLSSAVIGKASKPMPMAVMASVAVMGLGLLIGWRSRKEVKIIFTGYLTEMSSHGITANFVVTNAGWRVAEIRHGGVIEKNGGVWDKARWDEEIYPAAVARTIILLSPKESFESRFWRPTNCESWRAFVLSDPSHPFIGIWLGEVYKKQPLRSRLLSDILKFPVLHWKAAYSEEIKN